MAKQNQVVGVPEIRIRKLNEQPTRSDGDYVLYWMVANRRRSYNYSLQRAVEWAEGLGKPIVVLEALRVGYRWASDRIHQFVIEGMSDNVAAFADSGVYYYPYLEPESGAGAGLIEALAQQACVVVSDDFPCFFIPTMLKHVARKIDVSLEAIDSNGLLPMHATEQVFPTAHAFRRFLQKNLPTHIVNLPDADPLEGRKLKNSLGCLRRYVNNGQLLRRSITRGSQGTSRVANRSFGGTSGLSWWCGSRRKIALTCFLSRASIGMSKDAMNRMKKRRAV